MSENSRALAPGAGWQNALNFGADPTGHRDSTSAIQAALDASAGATFTYP